MAEESQEQSKPNINNFSSDWIKKLCELGYLFSLFFLLFSGVAGYFIYINGLLPSMSGAMLLTIIFIEIIVAANVAVQTLKSLWTSLLYTKIYFIDVVLAAHRCLQFLRSEKAKQIQFITENEIMKRENKSEPPTIVHKTTPGITVEPRPVQTQNQQISGIKGLSPSINVTMINEPEMAPSPAPAPTQTAA